MAEIDNKTRPLRISISENEKTVQRIAQANDREIANLEKQVNDFSKEIQRMKDDIRERTIDLEL